MNTAQPATDRDHIRRIRIQLAYGVAGLALLAFCIFEAVKYGWAAGIALIVFGLLPDLTLIGGFRRGLEPGQLAPSQVRLYNLSHGYPIPVALMLASLLPWPELWLRSGLEIFLAGLAWFTHITVDRALGFGLRTPDGFQRYDRPRA